MYCSSCGAAVSQDLSYCNRCGAKLNGVKGDSAIKLSEAKPESLINAIVAVFVCGLGAIIGLMAVMKAVLNLLTVRKIG
jgi:predicted amidophosphoribosyltransferase